MPAESVASYEARSISPVHWLSKLSTDLLHEGGLVAKTLSDASAFYTLLMIALEKSGSFSKLEAELIEQGKRRKEVEVRETIETWKRAGWECYIDADGAAHLGEPPADAHGYTHYPVERTSELESMLEKHRAEERRRYAEMDEAIDSTLPPADEPDEDEEFGRDVDATDDAEPNTPVVLLGEIVDPKERPPEKLTLTKQGRFEGLD